MPSTPSSLCSPLLIQSSGTQDRNSQGPYRLAGKSHLKLDPKGSHLNDSCNAHNVVYAHVRKVPMLQ